MRKIFTVLVNNKEYDMYDIKGKEHAGHNDVPTTWWLYYSERLPEGMFPPVDSEYWQPGCYCSGALRSLWDVRIKQHNTTKVKWGDVQFNNHTSVEIYCNNKPFYSFGTGGKNLDFAMAKVQYLQVVLSEHPFNFYNPHSENGRKIWWYGMPATVKVWRQDEPWLIGIQPDYTDVQKDEWWPEYHRRKSKYKPSPEQVKNDAEFGASEDPDGEFINWGDAFSDGHIDWFRK